MLVEQLEKVNVDQMEDNARTAFWINVYNSLVMHVCKYLKSEFQIQIA